MISPPALALALAIFQSDVPLHLQGSVDVLPQAAFVQRVAAWSVVAWVLIFGLPVH
jgi:hypothetical protein